MPMTSISTRLATRLVRAAAPSLLAAFALLAPGMPQAQPAAGHGDHGGHGGHATATATATATGIGIGGEVRRIDRDTQRITLRHGPIPALGMAAMTMVYRVRDAALLDGLAVGDTVTFSAEHVNGANIVTAIRK